MYFYMSVRTYVWMYMCVCNVYQYILILTHLRSVACHCMFVSLNGSTGLSLTGRLLPAVPAPLPLNPSAAR